MASCMTNLSKFHIVFSSSGLIRLNKDAVEGRLWQTVNYFVKQNKSSLLSPLRKRWPPQLITCIVYHAGVGRLGTLKYNSFRWRSISMFKRLLKYICMLSSCSIIRFKSELNSYLRNIVDLPCLPGFNNSLDGVDCLHGGHYADNLAANYRCS